MLVVYQMGKCASMAIYQGLKKRGLNVHHSHLLGRERLLADLSGFLSPAPENPLDQNLEGVLQSIRTTRELLRCKKNGQRVKIITLARDPMSWWPSGFIQNYDSYYREVMPCLRDNGIAATSSSEAIKLFLEMTFERLSEIPAPFDAEGFDKAIWEPNSYRRYYVIASQCRRIAQPLAWFDKCFLPVTGIDIYATGLQAGYQIYENEHFDVLLMRFEDLRSLRPVLREFVGLEDFDLPVFNVSESKPMAEDVRRAWTEAQMPAAVMTKIQGTRYCRHFGYRID